MQYYSKQFGIIKQHLLTYFNQKTSGLSPHIRRTINEISYGVLDSGDVVFSNIARSLNENNTLQKTIFRLSTNISKTDLTKTLNDKHLKDIKPFVEKKSIIVIDDSDINKPRSRKQEGLCPIRDASTGEYGNGYNIIYSTLVSEDRKQVKSLITSLYSSLEKGFKSRNDERDKTTRRLKKEFGDNGVYVMDRGFSNLGVFQSFKKNHQYVIRLKSRNIIYKNKTFDMKEWSNRLHLEKYMQITSIKKNGKQILKDVAFTTREIEFGGETFNATVMKLEDHYACVLISNQEKNGMSDYEYGKMLIEQYGCRWSVEEKIRFEKTQFNYENIRLQKLTGLKNMMAIINLLSSFISDIYWKDVSSKIVEVAKVLKKEVRFEYYRLAAGIKRIFNKRIRPPFKYKNNSSLRYFPRSYQLAFFEVF